MGHTDPGGFIPALFHTVLIAFIDVGRDIHNADTPADIVQEADNIGLFRIHGRDLFGNLSGGDAGVDGVFHPGTGIQIFRNLQFLHGFFRSGQHFDFLRMLVDWLKTE